MDKIIEQFKDIMVRLLILAAFIQICITLATEKIENFLQFVEPLVIVLILLANTLVSIYQDYSADQALSNLKKL